MRCRIAKSKKTGRGPKVIVGVDLPRLCLQLDCVVYCSSPCY